MVISALLKNLNHGSDSSSFKSLTAENIIGMDHKDRVLYKSIPHTSFMKVTHLVLNLVLLQHN